MKRFLKAIGLFMVVILCIGAVSTLFDGDSDKPTGPGATEPRPSVPETDEPSEPEEPTGPEEPSCTHVDEDDNELCDKCGESFSDGTDVEEPEETENTYDKDSHPVRLPSY